MRARKELDEENYKRKMAFLAKEKARLKELLNDTDDRINKQLENTERVFTFARDTKKAFEKDDSERQKVILSNLGSNLLLKDKILTISMEKPLIPMGKVAQEVKAIHNKVRTSKNGENKRTLRKLYAQSPTLLPNSKLIIILENRDYIGNLKNKLTEIKKLFQKYQNQTSKNKNHSTSLKYKF